MFLLKIASGWSRREATLTPSARQGQRPSVARVNLGSQKDSLSLDGWYDSGMNMRRREFLWLSKNTVSSPDEPQRELDIAVVRQCLGDRAELRRIERPVRNLKLRSIHDVEELRAELQLPPAFGAKGNVFEYGHVKVCERRTCPDVSTRIPKRESVRYAEGGSVDPPLHGAFLRRKVGRDTGCIG